MECNKEEAVKAMKIAEKKLEISDFIGARKMAQTSHRLFPTLENITQLLTVCEIHCSAQNKICGSENDWYGILQIEKSADEMTIKKQYRKLALLLHPDKNKFSGAEAAFKLVGEAHMLLSDQSKRKLYDMKCGAARRNIAPSKPTHDRSNGYATMNKQESGTANGCSSVPFSHFSERNCYKPPPPQQQVFWTCCPFCNVRYQYLKCYLNRMLRCQNCGRGFISHELDSYSVPPPHNQGCHVPSKKAAPESGPSKSAAPNKHGSDKKFRDRSANDLHAKAGKKQNEQHRDVENGQDGSAKPKSEAEITGKVKSRSNAATSTEKRAPKSEIRKRKRKSANAQEVEDDDEKDPGQSRGSRQKRSSRNKNHASYKYLSDDDGMESSTDVKEKMKDASADVAASKVDKSNGNGEEPKVMRAETHLSDQNDKKSEVEDVDTDKINVSVILECADPEFSDFDKDKMENCFAVNQVWAIYDTIDGMPRFYARIRKVFSPAFKLQFTWFEPNPDDKDEINWSDAELPIACGKYTLGDTEETVDLPMFSHLVHCPKQESRKNTYFMYPRKGDTWALFKDWDIKWSSETEKHEAFEYEFVEILSDYIKDVGISVTYMEKVKGFVCLFQTTDRLNSFKIAPNELYRFSHQIPSFRMTGKERDGVPEGSFELDPASLPPNITDRVDADLNNVERETDNAAASGRIDPSHDYKSPKVEEEVICLENNEAANIQKSNLKSEAPPTERSPRKLNTTQVNIDSCMPEDNVSKVASQNGISTHKESGLTRINEGTNTPKKHKKNDIEREAVKLRRSPRDLAKKNAV